MGPPTPAGPPVVGRRTGPGHPGFPRQFEQAVHAGQLSRQSAYQRQPEPQAPQEPLDYDDYPDNHPPEEQQDRADHGYDPLGEDAEEPRSSSRLARTIAVTVVAIIATGVVTAVAAVGGEPPRRLTPSVPVVQPVDMSGADVVRLSVVIDTLSLGSPEVNPSALPVPTAGTPGPGSTDGTGQPSSGTSSTNETGAGLLAGTGEAAASSAPSAVDGTAVPDVPGADVQRELAESLVMGFYKSLPRQKPVAYSLLGPTMQGDGQESFEASWLRASDVNPNILSSDDGSVRASITVSRFTDPEVTRLIVRLEVRPIMVEGSSQLRIVDAQLLSAHRS